jgi:hypothetical protein
MGVPTANNERGTEVETSSKSRCKIELNLAKPDVTR